MENITQVVRPALGAPAVKTQAVRSAFDMARDYKSAKPVPSIPPQEALLQALVDKGGIRNIEELRSAMSGHVDSKALSNAIYHSKKANRLRKVGHALEITAEGRAYLKHSDVERAADDKFKRKASPRQAATKRESETQDATALVLAQGCAMLRWAKWSDGGFVLQRGDCVIELSPDEFNALRVSVEAS